MNAITITDSSAQGLKLNSIAIPEPKATEVLIRVVATGVNRADIMQRLGHYPPPFGASPILGLEVSGIIVKCGLQVHQFQIGDRVCALISGGGYAEYCVADSESVLPIPSSVNLIEAASLPETYFTVWSNLFQNTLLNQNDYLFIQGGSSGIGITAIQLANAFGIKVIATTGTKLKCQRLYELGVQAAIHYPTQDFVSEIEQITSGKGVKVILDILGGNYVAKHLRCLAIEGYLIQIAAQYGIKSEINLLSLMAKRLTLTGSTLRARDNEFKAKIAQQLYTHVWHLFANQKIRPIIDQIFPLANATAAHQRMDHPDHFGKIVLIVDESITP
jgi:putative PIG3 family NAD(P)H quinone oxidoreductase